MAVAIEPRARCSPLPALNVAKAPKSRFNPAVISPFTAAIATGKSALVDTNRKVRLNHESHPGWTTGLDVAPVNLSFVFRSINT
jgi:hypothetical protein